MLSIVALKFATSLISRNKHLHKIIGTLHDFWYVAARFMCRHVGCRFLTCCYSVNSDICVAPLAINSERFFSANYLLAMKPQGMGRLGLGADDCLYVSYPCCWCARGRTPGASQRAVDFCKNKSRVTTPWGCLSGFKIWASVIWLQNNIYGLQHSTFWLRSSTAFIFRREGEPKKVA